MASRVEFAFMVALGTQQITYEDPQSKKISTINCLVISVLEQSQKIEGHNFSDHNFVAIKIENGIAKSVAVHHSIAEQMNKDVVTHVIERLDGDKFKILDDDLIIKSMDERQYKDIADQINKLSTCCILL